MKINEVIVKEQATAGATSAGNIASVVSPHIAIGRDRFKKSYTGTPGTFGDQRHPTCQNPRQQKPTDNALDITGTSLFGGPAVSRNMY